MKKVFLIMSLIFVIIAIVVPSRFFFMGKASQEMSFKSNFVDSKFIDCPDKPNCVSSFSKSEDSHYISPIKFSASKVKNIEMYLKALKCEKSSLVTEEFYWHYTCQSEFFGFVDDIELYFDNVSNLLHFRSASRVGHSDLDANKKRVILIKTFLTAH